MKSPMAECLRRQLAQLLVLQGQWSYALDGQRRYPAAGNFSNRRTAARAG